MIQLSGTDFQNRLAQGTLPEKYYVSEDVYLLGQFKRIDLKNGVFEGDFYLSQSQIEKFLGGNAKIKGNFFGERAVIKIFQAQNLEIKENLSLYQSDLGSFWFDDLKLDGKALFGEKASIAKAFQLWYTTDKKVWVDHRALVI